MKVVVCTMEERSKWYCCVYSILCCSLLCLLWLWFHWEYNNDRNVGKIVFNRDDDEEMEELYKVVSCKKVEGDDIYTLKPLTDRGEDTLEVNDDELCDSWMTLPPPHVRNRWERFQNRRIGEGVFMAVAEKTLQDTINVQIDELAANEPVDYHPGSGEVVRDLVHPSLYPLILDAASIDTTKHNFWNRPHEQSRFQWLPTEVAIDAAGKAKFVSPINNLDTEKYPALTNSLEEVFTALVPGFEKVGGNKCC